MLSSGITSSCESLSGAPVSSERLQQADQGGRAGAAPPVRPGDSSSIRGRPGSPSRCRSRPASPPRPRSGPHAGGPRRTRCCVGSQRALDDDRAADPGRRERRVAGRARRRAAPASSRVTVAALSVRWSCHTSSCQRPSRTHTTTADQQQEVPGPVARGEGAPRRQGGGVRRHAVRLRPGPRADGTRSSLHGARWVAALALVAILVVTGLTRRSHRATEPGRLDHDQTREQQGAPR